MTVPMERTNAVIWTEQFLKDLCNPQVTPRVPKIVRDQARHLLRHYPTRYEMERIAEREDAQIKPGLHYKIFGKSWQ